MKTPHSISQARAAQPSAWRQDCTKVADGTYFWRGVFPREICNVMMEIPRDTFKILGFTFHSHLVMDDDSGRLQVSPGGLANLFRTKDLFATLCLSDIL